MSDKKMNVLFLTLGDLKNLNEKSIYHDLLREFVKNKHDLFIVSPTERRNKEKTRILKEENCTILKVKMGNIQKTNMIEKGISTLLIESQFKFIIKKYFSNIKFDLVLYSTPPITFEKVVNMIKKKDQAKTYLLLKDIFPQNAVDLELFSKKSLIYHYFRQKEKRLYQNSDSIGCISKRNVDYLLKHNPEIDSKIIHVSPNSVELITIQKNERERIEIQEKYRIPIDKIIFVYGGNLGKPQGIDFFMDCMKTQRENQKVFFLVIGSGTEYQKLKEFQEKELLENFRLLSFLEKEAYEHLVSACDIGMIFLDKRFTIPNFPSRLLSYMQASMPVVACTDVNTDIGEVIQEGDFGWWCESRDPHEFKVMIDAICNDPEKIEAMGKNARRYLEDHYTVKHTYDAIMSHIK